MWHAVTPELPYLQDPDYLSALSFHVRSALGPDAHLDSTLAEAGYQVLEVDTPCSTVEEEAVLSRTPLVRSVRRFNDRMMRDVR
jgi:hypothetical protein